MGLKTKITNNNNKNGVRTSFSTFSFPCRFFLTSGMMRLPQMQYEIHLFNFWDAVSVSFGLSQASSLQYIDSSLRMKYGNPNFPTNIWYR